jgi:hypothetical protein
MAVFKKGNKINTTPLSMNENMEIEVEPEDISLRSFKVRDYLENHIWDDEGNLDLSVRRALMDISDDFWKSCNVRWVKPKTVLLTGSICNFNWSKYSDIDVHLVVDFSKVHSKKDFVQEYFDEKKNEWNNAHDKLKVYGFPVEMYVEDVDTETVSGGIYDLYQNKWIKKPTGVDIKPIKLNKYGIKEVASVIMTEIDDMCDEFQEETDKHKIEVIGEKCEELLSKIKAIRKTGLKKGEMGSGNIVYKVIKRSGYMDKLWKLSTDIYDKLNSINEEMTFESRIRTTFSN